MYFTILPIIISRGKTNEKLVGKTVRLSEFNTNIKTELLAGLTTFVTMAYVLATIPNILAGAGYDKHTTLTAMILLIILTMLCNGFGH